MPTHKDTGLTTPPRPHACDRQAWLWLAGSIAIVLLVGVLLRFGTGILNKDLLYDEPHIIRPIADLIERGWSVRTAIDFEETKGPGLIWPYAALGAMLGGALNDLRLLSVAFFVLGALPLVLICRRLQMRGPAIAAAAAMYALLPYHAVLSQLLMSEPLFIFTALWLMWIFLWGFGDSAANERRILGPILFALLLSAMLHNRVHAVAFAAAVALVAFERDGVRSWPWWLACFLAGLSRIPLWLRWGGLVSPEYQDTHDLGLRLESLTYLGAAMLPFTAAFLWMVIADARLRRWWWLPAGGAVVGLLLGIFASPSLELTEHERFQGIAATCVRTLSDSHALHHVMLAAMATIGLASLGALAAVAWRSGTMHAPGVTFRLLAWTLITGWAMYALTSGFVFDRYITPWAVLLPAAWVLTLPRWLVIAQAIGLLLAAAWHARVWLM